MMALRRRWRSSCCYTDLGAVHHLQVRLGPDGERLVAVRGGRRLGDRAGRAAAAGCSSASAPQRLAVLGLVSSTLAYLGCGAGHRGLDDVRR
ncbi:MAG: hypothetical protein MZW92_75140 [Comamonadaceae bacterium]|nr:hypothetical protein [Comamonadaceae bacterium]